MNWALYVAVHQTPTASDCGKTIASSQPLMMTCASHLARYSFDYEMMIYNVKWWTCEVEERTKGSRGVIWGEGTVDPKAMA